MTPPPRSDFESFNFTYESQYGTAYITATLDEPTQKWTVTVSDFVHRPIHDLKLRDAAVRHAHARISSLRLHLWNTELRHP